MSASTAKRSSLPWIAATGLGAAGVVIAAVAVGAGLDAPTVFLAIACLSLGWALFRMKEVAGALARRGGPELSLSRVELLARAGEGGKGALADEKRRVLRGIRELEFDHEMGKLADGDFQELRVALQIRAVELTRALEGHAELHPDLEAELGRRAASARCPSCGTKVSREDRFCAACGAGLEGDKDAASA